MALKDSLLLASAQLPNWSSDLIWVLRNVLPPNTHVPPSLLSSEDMIDDTRKLLMQSAEQWAADALQQSSKLILLQNRQEIDRRGLPVPAEPLKRRFYLQHITIPKHRTAYIRLVTSNHALAVERLRWAERRRPHIPREWRLCRFCRTEVEDEAHALLECTASPSLVDLRAVFLAKLFQDTPSLQQSFPTADRLQFLRTFLHRHETLPLVAKFVFQVLELYDTVDIWVPAQYIY
ncbi:hypothetical protein V5O48_013072 [Marasmius crinis-equi]|uniref:Reverse transcriptase zinc-binding domain-containing protein n=1 Tax=Marasmius crinis-equi TaxID=585013 RepID=A0ABR3F120_9AGAR